MDDVDALRVLLERSSCRDYDASPIPPEDWARILAAGQQAPTDATGQLYSAVDVSDAALRERIAALAGDQSHVRAAPKLLVVCLDVRRLRLLLEYRGERLGIRPLVALLFGITDASLFAAHLVLAAQVLGYGCCYLGAVQNHGRAIARELGLPEGVVPLWGLTVGRPTRRLPPKPRVPARFVVHENRYRDPAPQDLGLTYEKMRAATRSGDWLNPIRKYFAQGGIMDQREEEWLGLLVQQDVDPRRTTEPAEGRTDGHVGI